MSAGTLSPQAGQEKNLNTFTATETRVKILAATAVKAKTVPILNRIGFFLIENITHRNADTTNATPQTLR